MNAMLRTIGVISVFVLFAVVRPADAAEEIQNFDVLVEVRPDGVLEVTETIHITVEGAQVKRGIIRDLPLERRGQRGSSSRVSFEVTSVRRNGEREAYQLLHEGRQARIRIGRAEHLLPVPSKQVYEISYRTPEQLRGFEGYDELYWNVTGDRWDFPILAASVDIRLPEGTEILQHAGYTGPYGAQGTDFEVLDASPGRYRAKTTARLRPGEGFTVAIAWPKGLIDVPENDPADAGSTLYVLAEVRLAAVGATLAGAIALFLMWLEIGRNPAGGAIYARFEPPDKLGPAAARYVQSLGFDSRCLTAAIISMAVKGALRIVERPSEGLFGGQDYSLEPLGSDGKGLTPGERSAYGVLFAGSRTLKLVSDETNGAKVDSARDALRSKLREEHYGASFKRNLGYSTSGALVGLAVMLLFLALDWVSLRRLLEWLLPALFGLGTAYVVGIIARQILEAANGVAIPWRRMAGQVFPFLVFLVIAFTMLNDIDRDGIAGLLRSSDWLIVVAGAVFGAVVALFHFLMAAPTKAGRKLMDQIEGFALYLRTAEEERLNILNPPDRTPELFERLLPYAVALGLAHEWSGKFASVLSATTLPDWYDGTGQFDSGRFDRSFGSAVSSAGQPSSGSGGSGSSGGGFSGGGGGGGGGSGW